jgi:hypothetical protein
MKQPTKPTDARQISPLWLVPTGIIIASALATLYGRGSFFLGLAGAALLGAIWVFWRSLQNLTGDAPLTLEEAVGLGAPSAEEERKTAVLRALKDLEYERAVGKIEEDDFQQLSHKYRAEARHLLQVLDEELAPARARAEQLLQDRFTEQTANEDPNDEARDSSADLEVESGATQEKSRG